MKNIAITIFSTLVGIAVVGIIYTSEPKTAQIPEASDQVTKAVAIQKFEQTAIVQAKPDKPQPAVNVENPSKGSGDWTAAEIEEDFVKAYVKYPHLRETAMYASKALISDAEMANWRKSLEDKTLIRETLKGLVEHYNPDYDLEGSIVNQERIKYLKYSAQLAGNPAGAELFAGIERFITNTEMDMADFSDKLKRDVAGDKIELIYIYEAFQQGGKQKLDELAANSPKFAKLLKYARDNSQHLNRII